MEKQLFTRNGVMRGITLLPSYNLASLSEVRSKVLIASILFLLLCLYSFYFRTFQVTEHFHLLGDQVRDWNWALKPFSELPRVGTPTSQGGYCFGPIFYWTLWFIRITIGRFYDNLPHAGGIGLAAIHSIADGILLLAILKRGIPIIASVAIMLLFVSSAFEASLSGTIWNPGLSVSFVELATAFFLMIPNSHWVLKTLVTSTAAWLAVQSHTQAIFFALSLLVYLIVQPWIVAGWRPALQRLLIIIAVIGVLQIPYVTEINKRQDMSQEQLGIVATSFTKPSLHPYASFTALVDALAELFGPHLSRTVVVCLIVVAGGALLFGYRMHHAVLVVALLPLFLVWLGYSFLSVGTLYTYWYMNLMPSFVLLILFGFLKSPFPILNKVSALLGALVLLLAVASQPARLATRAQSTSYPYYAAIVQGAKEIVRNGTPVRSVIPPSYSSKVEPSYVVQWLGGRVEQSADLIAIIGEDGSVTYQKAADEEHK
jgi:type IV secretory pathway VirB2 component (pilin)